MKKPLALFALLCALLLSGCQTALLPRDAAARAQRVEIADAAAGESLDVLESERSLEAFVEALKLEDWQMAELPEGAELEGLFTLYQEDFFAALFRGEPAELQEICTLCSYREVPYLTIQTGLGDISFFIPESAAAYLHSLMRRPAA